MEMSFYAYLATLWDRDKGFELNNYVIWAGVTPLGAKQMIFRFPNNYGASIIHSWFSQGHESGLFELAVLEFEGEEEHITYDTPITDDVLGYLSSLEVYETLVKILRLPGKNVLEGE